MRRFGTGVISDRLFLDVYTANDRAFKLYQEKCGFVVLNPENPVPDSDENNAPDFVMARNVSLQTKA